MSHAIKTVLLCIACYVNGTNADSLASHNLLAIDKAMLPVYAKEHTSYQRYLLSKIPVIVARFSQDGGRLTLYRPHQKPLQADPVPVVYQYAKSIGHAVMISVNMTSPYVNQVLPPNTWQKDVMSFQKNIDAALRSMKQLDASDESKHVFQTVLHLVNQYLLTCLHENKINPQHLQAFVMQTRAYLPKLINIAADAQITHIMKTLNQWKSMLGTDWEKVNALTNTIYVTRQNNLLFSMLAEFMGKDSINHRLFLFETTTFTTTDHDLLQLWARIQFDRQLSDTVFHTPYLMDYELLANGGRQIIIDTAKTYHLPNILPPLAPFNSTEWPWHHDPTSGTGAVSIASDF